MLHAAAGAGFTGSMSIAAAAEAGTAWTVTQNDRSWPVQLDAIAVNPADGAVTARSKFADVLMLNRYYGWYVNTAAPG